MGLPLSPDMLATRPSLGDLMALAVQAGASDLHIRAGTPPLIRVNGALRPCDSTALSGLEAETLVLEALRDPRDRHAFEDRREHDFAVTDAHGERFRGSAYLMRGTLAMVLRHVQSRIPTLAELELPPVLRNLALATSGLIIVAGPTGSGKSTTLAAMIECINASRACHILTIEDPIEFLHTDQLASISQREVHTDTASFATALRSGLRQDPDVIMIGEIRDLETLRTALYAAESGHLVAASIHAKSATDAVNRIIDTFPADEQAQARSSLAESLRGIVCQRLIPSLRGGRREMALEIAIGTVRLQEAIVEDVAAIEEIVADGQFYGMRSFEQDLVRLVVGHAISADEAEHNCSRPADLRVALRQAGFKEAP